MDRVCAKVFEVANDRYYNRVRYIIVEQSVCTSAEIYNNLQQFLERFYSMLKNIPIDFNNFLIILNLELPIIIIIINNY